MNEVNKEYKQNYHVADFYEPLKFEWTKRKHEIRQAAKKFSETTLQSEEARYNDVEQCWGQLDNRAKPS